MQRRVLLLGAGVALFVVVLLGIRAVTRQQAGQVLDQGIGQFVARLPPGYAVRHGATDYNPLTSALSVRDVVLTRDGATLATADTVTVSGADGPALQDVFDPAAYPNGRPAWTDRRLLVADASAQGVHLMLPGPKPETVALRSVSLHRLSGRPFMLPPTPENRLRPEFQADAALALVIDMLQAHDAVWTTQAASRTSIAVGSAMASDYDAGTVGSLAIKAVALDGDGKPRGAPFHLGVAAFDLKTANLRGLLEAIRRNDRADRGMLGSVDYEAVNLSDLVFDLISGPHLAMADLHATHAASDRGEQSGGEAWIHGLTIGTGQMALSPPAAAAVTAFGMNAVTMDVDAKSGRQVAGAPMQISEAIVLHDLGTLHLQGSFSGYDAALASPAQPLGALLATRVDHASVAFEDRSLTGRLLAVAAVQMHSTPDVVRAQLAMPVVTLALMLPDQPDAADQVTAFLNHPGTLTVTMDPPAGVTIGAVSQAPAFARAHLLGVHIAAR